MYKFDDKHKIKVNGRVLDVFDDTKYNIGLILLTDEGPETKDFAKLFTSKLYKFPLI